jgi:hypothetical protein
MGEGQSAIVAPFFQGYFFTGGKLYGLVDPVVGIELGNLNQNPEGIPGMDELFLPNVPHIVKTEIGNLVPLQNLFCLVNVGGLQGYVVNTAIFILQKVGKKTFITRGFHDLKSREVAQRVDMPVKVHPRIVIAHTGNRPENVPEEMHRLLMFLFFYRN